MDKKIQKDQKTKQNKPPTATSEELIAKAGCMPFVPNTNKGMNKSPKPPLQPESWTHPYPHPM